MSSFHRPNICIEREEIDESKRSNSTILTSTQRPTTTEADGIVVDDELVPENSPKDDELKTRRKRQFSAHVRMSSCNDEGISYVCETKYTQAAWHIPTVKCCNASYIVAEFGPMEYAKFTRRDTIAVTVPSVKQVNSVVTLSSCVASR